MKKCFTCNQEKDLNEFGTDRQKLDGLSRYCKVCIRVRSSKQRQDNPGYYKDYAALYRKKNGKVLKKKARITYYVDWHKRMQQSKRSYEKHKKEIALKRAKKRQSEEERQKNRIRAAEWRKWNKTSVGQSVSRWKKDNPQKAAAHTLVLWAVKTGVLKRMEKCQECGVETKTEAHHEDYLKPLQVIWTCKLCHSYKHRKYR